jgi:hypothetical protein
MAQDPPEVACGAALLGVGCEPVDDVESDDEPVLPESVVAESVVAESVVAESVVLPFAAVLA